MGGLTGVAISFAFLSGVVLFSVLANSPPVSFVGVSVSILLGAPAYFALWVWSTIRAGNNGRLATSRNTQRDLQRLRGDTTAGEQDIRTFDFVTSMGIFTSVGTTGPVLGPQRVLCLSCCLWCFVFGWWNPFAIRTNVKTLLQNTKGGKRIRIREVMKTDSEQDMPPKSDRAGG